jgi:cell division protein ZapA (FtsZ GTPase activity inhibitor)
MNVNEAKKYTIRILDDEYTLLSDESPADIQAISRFIDHLAQEIAAQLPKAEPKKVLALVALRIANDVHKVRQSMNQLEEQNMRLIHYIDNELKKLCLVG